jgi:hypothetical protein
MGKNIASVIVLLLFSSIVFAQTEKSGKQNNEVLLSNNYVGYKRNLFKDTYLRITLDDFSTEIEKIDPLVTTMFISKENVVRAKPSIGLEFRKPVIENFYFMAGLAYSPYMRYRHAYYDNKTVPIDQRHSRVFELINHSINLPVGFLYNYRCFCIGAEIAPGILFSGKEIEGTDGSGEAVVRLNEITLSLNQYKKLNLVIGFRF